jgi:hypothetical protein
MQLKYGIYILYSLPLLFHGCSRAPPRRGVDMSKFISRLKKIYEEEKDLENPPGYLEIIEEILEIDARLNKNKNVSGGG